MAACLWWKGWLNRIGCTAYHRQKWLAPLEWISPSEPLLKPGHNLSQQWLLLASAFLRNQEWRLSTCLSALDSNRALTYSALSFLGLFNIGLTGIISILLYRVSKQEEIIRKHCNHSVISYDLFIALRISITSQRICPLDLMWLIIFHFLRRDDSQLETFQRRL